MIPLRRFFLATLLLACSGTAAAQVPDTTATDSLAFTLPELTVEAVRAAETTASAPFAVSVLARSPGELALTPGFSLDDVLQPLAGVWISDRHHFALGERIAVRGMGYRANFGARGIQVILDGIPLTLPDGQAFLDVVDPAVVRRAELVRTPASVFWGNGSGGVLFLSTQPSRSTPPLRARVQTGSYGRQQGLLEGQAPAGRWQLHGYASGVQQDGFRNHSTGYRLRTGLGARRLLGPRTQLRLIAAADYQDTENPSSLTEEQVDENRKQARPDFLAVNAGKQSGQAQVGVTVDHTASAALELSGTAYGLVRDLDNPLPFAYVSYVRQSGGLRLTMRRQSGRLQGGAGVDAALQHDDRINYQTTADGEPSGPLTLNQIEDVSSAAAFGYARYTLAAGFSVTGGLRIDRIRFSADDQFLGDGDQSGSRTFSAWSPSFGVSYDVGPALFFAHYSTAFETPTTTELVNRPGGGGGFNPQLDPQRIRGFEFGTRGAWTSARLTFDLALFRLRVKDLISSFEGPSGREFFRNRGENTHDGVELSLTWQPVDAVEAAVRYAGSRFVLDEAEDASLEENRVPGIPSHRLYAHVEAEQRGWWGRVAAEAVDAYYVDDANTDTTPGYVKVDLYVGHRGLPLGTTSIQPFAAVENVFDERYNGSVVINAFGGRYYEPAPGRTWSLGVNLAL